MRVQARLQAESTSNGVKLMKLKEGMIPLECHAPCMITITSPIWVMAGTRACDCFEIAFTCGKK